MKRILIPSEVFHMTHSKLIHREKPQEYLEALQHFVSAREG